jgi:1,4-dihydroxy-2-naphthoate polyprenyltransferase
VIKKSTIQLLRFHFSVFLMPVFWFALSETVHVNTLHAFAIFVILHIFIYPASNGYNSYMDRDTGSIGGLEKPLAPTRQLFWASVLMDGIAIAAGFFISIYFAAGLIAYIIASRAYSYRGIRLKKYPVWGYLTVVVFQGAVTFFLVMHGCSAEKTLQIPFITMAAASLLIGGFYPLTQIYQHQQDKADGVTTLSCQLGYRGTFFFTLGIYSLAMIVLAIYYFTTLQEKYFFILQIFLLPVFVYFFIWLKKVWHNTAEANFKNTMRMNILASLCTNLGFLTILILKQFE